MKVHALIINAWNDEYRHPIQKETQTALFSDKVHLRYSPYTALLVYAIVFGQLRGE